MLHCHVFNDLGHVPLAQWMSVVRSRHRLPRWAAPFMRIKHLVTRRSQYHMHLLSFDPPPGLAHLPTQFAALFSQCAASITAFAGELRRPPMPMRVIAKKSCRAMFESPEKGERATLNPNLSTRLKPASRHPILRIKGPHNGARGYIKRRQVSLGCLFRRHYRTWKAHYETGKDPTTLPHWNCEPEQLKLRDFSVTA
jgi:hypothetical protein